LRDSEGASALFMCCQNGHYDIIKLLYRYGARDELLYRNDGMVYSVINLVCRVPCIWLVEGNVDVIEFLLENGADVNKQGPGRLSPLHIAIHNKRFSVCKLILEYEQVSNQNIESGITMSRIAQAPEIQAMMEKALKKRRKVILVCFSI
jgi:ankyrin repeat protein